MGRTMSRELILRDGLIAELEERKKNDQYRKKRGLIERWVRNFGYDILILIAKYYPAANSVEVVYSQWLVTNDYILMHKCLMCGAASRSKTNYCPNCGAKMVGDT